MTPLQLLAVGIAGALLVPVFPLTRAADASLHQLSVTPKRVVGGRTTNCTLTLTSAAPEGGVRILLESNDPSLVSVPEGMTIAEGAASTAFTISTSLVASKARTTITATLDGVARGTWVEVVPEPDGDR